MHIRHVLACLLQPAKFHVCAGIPHRIFQDSLQRKQLRCGYQKNTRTVSLSFLFQGLSAWMQFWQMVRLMLLLQAAANLLLRLFHDPGAAQTNLYIKQPWPHLRPDRSCGRSHIRRQGTLQCFFLWFCQRVSAEHTLPFRSRRWVRNADLRLYQSGRISGILQNHLFQHLPDLHLQYHLHLQN